MMNSRYPGQYQYQGEEKMLSSIFEQFVKESPVSVMMRALMSHIFATERMDRLFTKYAQVQYQQDLLFSSQVDLMSLVVCGIHPSVHAAYRARAANLSVSTTALYNKLSGVELSVSEALVRETGQDLAELVKLLDSDVDEDIITLNVRSLSGTTPYDYLLYSDKISRRNDGRLRDRDLKKYQHIRHLRNMSNLW
jgi:hypothetical protein